jgi:dihydroorotate dehydrogenase
MWERGRQKPVVSYSAEEIAKVIAELTTVTSTDVTVGVKLSPILDVLLLEAVDAVIRNSRAVSFLTTTNTVPNCFSVTRDGRPRIDFEQNLGGMGGSAIKWLGQGQVVQHRLLLPDLPVVGVGGIDTGLDLVEYLSPLVGAAACQVATAFWQRGPRAFVEIVTQYADHVSSSG